MPPSPRAPAVMAWRALMEAQERVMEQLRPALLAHDLSISEFNVVVNLAPGEDCRHTELASRVVLSRTALTRLVDRLVDRGLLERHASQADARGVCVRLTDAGTVLRRAALRTNARVVQESFAGLTVAEAEQLHGLVTRVAAGGAGR